MTVVFVILYPDWLDIDTPVFIDAVDLFIHLPGCTFDHTSSWQKARRHSSHGTSRQTSRQTTSPTTIIAVAYHVK